MNIGFSKLKLSYKLALLIAFPFLSLIVVSLYTLQKDFGVIANHPILFSVMMALVIIYAALTLDFIRKLINGIKSIEQNAASLASGMLHSNGEVSGLQEVTNINKGIKKLENDLARQTKFAEQIKSRNLEANYELCHDRDDLGRALLDIKESLMSIKKEDEQRKWASESLAKFVEVLQSAENLKELSNDIIINLVRIIQASQGALFMLDEDTEGVNFLNMQACYAFNRTKHLTHKIAVGDGLIG